MNTESANKFIAALVKSLQTLCHGYVEFDDGIEIIGHLYLNIDSGSTFDYVVKEKVCKNAENATVFVSKSFHAEGKPENTLLVGDKEAEKLAANLHDHGMSSSGTTRLQSAITNISNVLSGAPGHLHSSHSSSHQNTGKRKREHNGNYSQHPYKYTTLQSSSSSSAMPYFSNNPAKHHTSNKDHLKHYNNPQSEFFGGDSNQSSGMGPDDEEDLDLDVTFVKEEYAERNRNAAAARAHQDPSTNQGNMLPENNGGEGGGNYAMGYHPNASGPSFVGAGGGGSDMTGIAQSFQDPSQIDMSQHHIPPPPNPRTTLTSAEGPNTLLHSVGPYSLAPGEFTPSAAFSEPGRKLKGESVIHTIRQNKWAVARAREFLNNQGMSTDFEQFSDNQLNEMLLSFYTSAQKKDGAPFSGTALLAFRTAMNRHLNQSGRTASLATSQVFKPSNAVLSRIISCTTKVNRAISVQDILLLYTNDVLSISNPVSLLNKVWFELQIHFRSKVFWDKVKVDQFMFSRNLTGKLCVSWNVSSLGNSGQVNIQGTGGKHCPAESLRLYLQRRHKSCHGFLQVPAPADMVKEGIWYAPDELKESKEKGLMKKLSVLGKLSKTYTNSCIVNSYEDYFQAMLNLRVESD